MTAYSLLPRRIWVGNYEFKVELREPNDQVFVEDPDSLPAEGVCDTGARVIYFANALELRRLLEVVLHETKHAINWVNDIEDLLGRIGKNGTTTEDIEEEITGVYGRAWSQLFLDNPKLQRWITRVTNQIRKEQASA